ncbi:MAG: hypothetical protein ABIH37_05730 [archaeon]
MRKISTRKDEIKKQKRNTLIISIILIVVISASVFGIVANSFGSSEEPKEVNYQGYSFFSSGNYWILKQGDFQFVFLNNPNELENLTFESNNLNLLPSYAQKVLYIYSEEPTASYQVYQNLDMFTERIQQACLEQDQEDCPENNPIKTCTDNFVIIKESNLSKILQQENCVFIEGKKEDLIKLTDIFLLKIFGIKS